jgi:hypothetical protein
VSCLGVGVGVAHIGGGKAAREIVGADFLELRATDVALQGAGDGFTVGGDAPSAPVIVRGAALSLGTMGPVDRTALAEVKRLTDATRCVYYGEPLCMTRVPGLDLDHLAPIWFTADVLASTIDRVDAVQQELGRPLLVESITYMPPRCAKPQAEFLSGLADATGCRLTVNVSAVQINSRVHGFDAADYLDGLPRAAVAFVRIGPGRAADAAWALAAGVASATRLEGVILDYTTRVAGRGPCRRDGERARSLLIPESGPQPGPACEGQSRQVVHV